jgi:hypothetical protein
MEGIDAAPMSIRLTPHILSQINWQDPLNDPLRRQFIPMKTSLQPDHPMLTLDSLHEKADSPVEGLVHRYTDKCLFLGVLAHWIFVMEHTDLVSYICLPTLLPILHSVICSRSEHRDCHKSIIEAKERSMGRHVQLHQKQSYNQRCCCFWWRLLVSDYACPCCSSIKTEADIHIVC